jgi:hypothetical protein
MGRTNSFQAWRRHWVLTTVLLLVALVTTTIATIAGPRSYQASGAVALLASRAVAKSEGDNPYLSFTGSLTLTADVLSRELMAPGTVSDLAERGVSDPYTVELATYTTTTTGSVLTVTITGPDPGAAAADLGAVINEIQAKLASLQDGLKPDNRIRMVTIAKSHQATLSASATARPLVMIAAGGLLIAFGLPWLVDAQLMARRARRTRAGAGLGTVAAAVDDPAGEGDGWPRGDLETGPRTRIYPRFAPRPAARPGPRGPGGSR